MTANKEVKLSLTLIYCDDKELLPNDSYVAAIEDGEFRGCVESGGTIKEAMKQLGISMQVLDDYRKKNAK